MATAPRPRPVNRRARGPGGVGQLAPGRFFAGLASHDADGRIIYNPATGVLVFDPNGNAPGGSSGVVFSQLPVGLAMTSGEFLVVA